MENKSKRSDIENALMLALACGATVEAAASKVGLSARTVYRYLDKPAFRRQLQAFRADMVNRATGMLSAASMEAVKTLLGLMQGNTTAASRLGAARAVLEMGIKLRQSTELEERMTKIEERLLQRDEGKLSG